LGILILVHKSYHDGYAGNTGLELGPSFFRQCSPRKAPAGMDFISENSSFYSRVFIHYSFCFFYARAENPYSFHFSPVINRAGNWKLSFLSQGKISSGMIDISGKIVDE
jgi:hypothetical protein